MITTTPFLCAASILCVGALVPVAAAYWERRMVWPYSETRPIDIHAIGQPYVANQIVEARALGFRALGRSHDLKGKAYKVDYFFLVSPNDAMLAIIGIGTVLTMSVKGIWLFSLGPDGTAFYSVNHQSCVEFDLSGRWKNQLVFDAGLARLCQAHQDWLQKLDAVILPFREGGELEDFRRARDSRVELMIQKGLARRTEANPEYWKYSLSGAFRCGLGGQLVGVARALKAGRV